MGIAFLRTQAGVGSTHFGKDPPVHASHPPLPVPSLNCLAPHAVQDPVPPVSLTLQRQAEGAELLAGASVWGGHLRQS